MFEPLQRPTTGFAALRTFLLCTAAAGLVNCGGGAAVGPAPATPVSPASSPATGTTAAPTARASSSPAPAPGTSASPAPAASGSPSTGYTTPSPNGNAADGIPFPASTDPDAFYAQPSPFPNVAHGALLGSRPSTYAPDGVSMPNTAYQIKFASQDMYGRKIAAVATVVLPLTPGAGTEPLLVEALAEDSLAAKCAPSHFVNGTATSDTELLEYNGVPTSLSKTGAALLVPDFEGPFSEYAVGRQEGLITLDAETAALAFAPLGLNSKTPIGQNGYSGGAHAVSWAAALQPSYAPQLNLVATASGGTPADILGILENIDGTSALSMTSNSLFFSIIYMSGVGINRGFPNFLTPIFNAKGVAAATAMENGCGGDNSDGSAGPTGHFVDYLTPANPDTDPHVTVNTAADSEPQPGIYPKTNFFLYNSVTDELIPVAGADKLYAGWCADGAPLEYFRDAAGGDHVTTEVDNIPIATAYFESIFAGSPATITPTTMTCNT